MQRSVHEERVEEFLDGLWHGERSLAQRVAAAYFIRVHGDAIEEFINRRISLSGANYSTVRWARKTRKLVARFRGGPRGYAYNPGLGTLETLHPSSRSFRLSGRHHESFTLPSRRPAVALAGYLVAALCLAAVLWLGFFLKGALEEFARQWSAQIEQWLVE
jgi:hypothetical protein